MDSTPFQEPAAAILRSEPTITDDQRADLFDIFHGTKSPEELVQHLQPLLVPDDLKQRLYDEKKKAVPPAEPLDKVTEAIGKISTIDPQTLELAEAHPNVLKVLTSAATTPVEKPAAPSKAASGKTNKPAPLSLPPRFDGTQHMSPIPEGHRRVLASDGGIHDIPEEGISKAFEIDPRLHVLNP